MSGDINRAVPSTEIKLRGKGSKPGKAKFEHLRFTSSSRSDQSQFADTPAGRQAAKKLEGMRESYKRFSMIENANIIPLSDEQKQTIFALKHNIKERDMQDAIKYFTETEAKEIKTTQEKASVYIKTDVIDCDPENFIKELREAHDKLAGEVLLCSFEKSFSAAARIIRDHPPFLDLVRKAGSANVKFGGYAELGPFGMRRAYCQEDTVYVPSARNNEPEWKSVAEFLFELNNGIGHPRQEALNQKARNNNPPMTREAYVHGMMEIEVDSMLQMGQIWFEVKATRDNPQELDRHDHLFFREIYEGYKNGESSKEPIVSKFLKDPAREGETYEDLYAEQFNIQQPPKK